MGGYTVIHFQNDLKVVINFLMQYIFDVCINGFDFGIRHHKQDLVDQMHTPVVDHAAAVFFIQMPFVHVSVAGMQLGFNRKNIAKESFIICFFHGQHILVPAPVLVRGEKDSCLLAGCLHLIELLHTHGSGLFGNNVLPGFGGLDAHFLVQIVGNGQDNGIDLRICQKLIRIRIQPIPHFNCFFLFFFGNVAYSSNLNTCSWSVLRMPFSHSAETDDSKFNNHKMKTSLLWSGVYFSGFHYK